MVQVCAASSAGGSPDLRDGVVGRVEVLLGVLAGGRDDDRSGSSAVGDASEVLEHVIEDGRFPEHGDHDAQDRRTVDLARTLRAMSE
jgi:hypothetical protein